MAAVRKMQSNGTLYTLITFVGISIVVGVVAVVFYSKFEKQQKIAIQCRQDLDEMANRQQLRDITKIVGAKSTRETYLGKTLDYLDETVAIVLGGPLKDEPAETKVDNVKRQFTQTLDLLAGQQPALKSAKPKPPANEFVQLLAGKKFVAAVETMDQNMKTALPADTLEQTWTATVAQVGAFKQQIGARTEKQAGYDVVLVTCEFEKGPLDVKIVYDNNRKVAGLFFVPTPPDVLKSYQPASEQPAQTGFRMERPDPNTTGLIRIVEKLKNTLDDTTSLALTLSDELQQLNNQFDDFQTQTREKERTLLADKERLQQQVAKIEKDYGDLEALTRKTSDERTQTVMSQLDRLKTQHEELQTDMLQTSAKLVAAEERIARLQNQIHAAAPPPDSNIPAYKHDGKILWVSNDIVHINIGTDDHVYRGLTFSVYNKGMPIPQDGKGKAEIEVYDVRKNVSAARITRSRKRRPIVVEDIVANLIWNSDKTNNFVILGDFDMNNDGEIDYDGVDKLKTLIERWGGRVSDTVSVDADFLILGSPPRALLKPTPEEMATDPTSMDKYEVSVRESDHYNEAKNQAQSLRIPVFNKERFLHFIGYQTMAARPDAF
ncbi:MAG: DUF3887 domain-containing protein [Planctomycetota bacterium]|jgi:hypothetical protein